MPLLAFYLQLAILKDIHGDCKKDEYGEGEIWREPVKADTEIVDGVFHADAALLKAGVNFIVHSMRVILGKHNRRNSFAGRNRFWCG